MSNQTYGFPPAFRNFTPSGPTLNTSVTSKQVFLNKNSTMPGSAHLPDARIYSLGLQDRVDLNVNQNHLKIGTLAGQRTTVTRNRVRFPTATRLEDNKRNRSVGLTLKNVRPCPETAESELDGCIKPVSVYDFADNKGGVRVPAPFGQSLESDADFCCNGDTTNINAGPVRSSAASQGNGSKGFAKNTFDGAASTAGYNLPANCFIGSFIGRNDSDPVQGAKQGQVVWLANQVSAYDANNNIRGRAPYQHQNNPIIFTNSNSDYYSQSY